MTTGPEMQRQGVQMIAVPNISGILSQMACGKWTANMKCCTMHLEDPNQKISLSNKPLYATMEANPAFQAADDRSARRQERINGTVLERQRHLEEERRFEEKVATFVGSMDIDSDPLESGKGIARNLLKKIEFLERRGEKLEEKVCYTLCLCAYAGSCPCL